MASHAADVRCWPMGIGGSHWPPSVTTGSAIRMIIVQRVLQEPGRRAEMMPLALAELLVLVRPPG